MRTPNYKCAFCSADIYIHPSQRTSTRFCSRKCRKDYGKETGIKRFWSRVGERDSKTGCMEWSGSRNIPPALPYGRVKISGVETKAHILAWKLINGDIPAGLWVLHKCDNPPCCNAREHLFLGTPQDNVLDAVRKGRWGVVKGRRMPAHAVGENHRLAKLNRQSVLEIRAKYIPKKYGAHRLGKEYGVSKPVIQSILKRKTWNHV